MASNYTLLLSDKAKQALDDIYNYISHVLLNVLGQHMDQAQAFCKANPQAHLHLYGKAEAKQNRKMGHVTVVGSEDEGEFGGKLLLYNII